MEKKSALANGTSGRPTSMATAAALLLGALLVLCHTPSGADAQGGTAGTSATPTMLGRHGRKLQDPDKDVHWLAVGGVPNGPCKFTVRNFCKKPVKISFVFYTNQGLGGKGVPGYQTYGWVYMEPEATTVFTGFLRPPAVRFSGGNAFPQPAGLPHSGVGKATVKACSYAGDHRFFSSNKRPVQWRNGFTKSHFPTCQAAGGFMDDYYQRVLSCDGRHTVFNSDC